MTLENPNQILTPEEKLKRTREQRGETAQETDPDRFIEHPVPHLERIHHDQEEAAALLNRLHKQPAANDARQKTQKIPDTVLSNPEGTASRAALITTNLVDFIPVIGSAKMAYEGLIGQQVGTGKKLSTKERLAHGISGAAFFALDITGIGALVSEAGKVGIKLGARMFEKEALEKIVTNKVAQEEGGKLTTRGKKRNSMEQNIAQRESAPQQKKQKQTNDNPEQQGSPDMKLAQDVLSKRDYARLQREMSSPEQTKIALALERERLTFSEKATTAGLATGLYLTIPAAVSLSHVTPLAAMASSSVFGAQGMASLLTAIQGSSVAQAVLPSFVTSYISTMSTATFGSLFLSLPLLTQAAILAPAVLAAGYVGRKLYRGIKNTIHERTFKKHYGESVSDSIA